MPSGVTVGDVGESRLLATIAERIPASAGSDLIGDDAAILPRAGAGSQLLTTDAVVEGVDFELGLSSGADIGWKALAINVSDVAAMGGTAGAAVATLGMPPTTPLQTFDSLLDGLIQGAIEWDLKLAGGDLSEAREIFCSVALVGTTEQEPVTRSGAQEGDLICVTGSFGASAAGLTALRHDMEGRSAEVDSAIQRYRRPQPRPREGVVLARAGVTSMIDVSDGLGLDLLRLLRASGRGCSMDTAAIPIATGVHEVCASVGEDPLDLAIGGGEDQELLFTVAPDAFPAVEQAVADLQSGVTVIGTVTGGERLADGRPLEDRKELGWEHLKNP